MWFVGGKLVEVGHMSQYTFHLRAAVPSLCGKMSPLPYSDYVLIEGFWKCSTMKRMGGWPVCKCPPFNFVT